MGECGFGGGHPLIMGFLEQGQAAEVRMGRKNGRAG
jgi:hypothetical protein